MYETATTAEERAGDRACADTNSLSTPNQNLPNLNLLVASKEWRKGP